MRPARRSATRSRRISRRIRATGRGARAEECGSGRISPWNCRAVAWHSARSLPGTTGPMEGAEYDRKQVIRAYFDRLGAEVDRWKARNRYYHDDTLRYFRYLVEP